MTQTQDGLHWLGELSDNWSQAMTAWQSLAKAVPGVEDAMGRMAEPAQAFTQFMAALGPGLSDGGYSAAEIAKRWRDALASGVGNVFAGQFPHGIGQVDVRQFATPLLDVFRQQITATLDAPAFGPGREQQERWQALAKAQIANQQAQSHYQALLGKVMEQAFARFEAKLSEHEAPGRQLGSLRAIYDLWIDAAEEAYAQIALSTEFGAAYGEMVNAQMRLRVANQNELERLCRELGMPTRSEVTAAHRKVHALERSMRALRTELTAKAASGLAPTPSAAAAAARTVAARKAPAKAARRSKAAAPKRKAKVVAKASSPRSKKATPRYPPQVSANRPRAAAREPEHVRSDPNFA